MKQYFLATLLVLVFSCALMAQTISSENLLEDYRVLKGVLKGYHPGLYRFQDSLAMEQNFGRLQSKLNKDLTLAEAYLAYSEFTASVRCGHTFCSYYNQIAATRDSLFHKADKVPFTFFLFERRMFVEKNLSESEAMIAGAEVLEIDGKPVGRIVDSLLRYAKGDGGNNLKRLIDLNLTGLGKYEAFDIYFPLLFPPHDGSYSLRIKAPNLEGQDVIQVKAISRAERFALMEGKYGPQPATLDELWSFEVLENNIGYLKIGTFVTNKLTIDWKRFLNDAFDMLNERGIQNLIIDVRGNEGGDDEVNLVLGNRLAKQQITLPAFKQLLRYEVVAPEYRAYLSTWDDSFYDRKGKVVKVENGFYTWKRERGGTVIKENRKAFQGNTYLLVDAANSSATFFLTAALQQNRLATVVGSETGGNRMGTNGGQLFFLRLPHTKIEIDLPLIGYYPLTQQPDRGLTPDIVVQGSLADLLANRDKVMEKTLELISAK